MSLVLNSFMKNLLITKSNDLKSVFVKGQWTDFMLIFIANFFVMCIAGCVIR